MKLMPLIPPESIAKESSSPIIHECRQKSKKSPVDLLIPGNEWKNGVKRWILHRCILSQNHQFAKDQFKSTAAINREIHRHIANYPYMIYPFSELRNAWEIFMILFIFFSLLILPFIVAFHFYYPKKWFKLFLFTNIFFALDVILNFFTGRFNKVSRVVILDWKIVAKEYLKTFFILDLISALPIQLIFLIISNYREPEWYWTFFSLFKIFYIRNLIIYTRKLKQKYCISFQKYKILEMSMILILCIHWASCLELYVSLVGVKINWQESNRTIWLHPEEIKYPTMRIYILCMSRAMRSLLSSSHVHEMKTTEDIFLNIFLTILGRIGFIYVLAQILMIMQITHSTQREIVKSLEQLQEYLHYKELSRSVQQKILTYYIYYTNKSYKKDKLIISNVSHPLQQVLLAHTRLKSLEHVNLFKHLPKPILLEIISHIKVEIYLADDVLVKFGTIGDALYFIVSGTVTVYSENGEKVCHLEDGSYFGEVALVMDNEKQLSTIIANETSEVYILTRKDFMRIMREHSNLMSHLQKLTIRKMNRTFPHEFIPKREESQLTDINIYQH